MGSRGFKGYVSFEYEDGSKRFARATSVMAIIQKYKLEPVNGEYKITEEMIIEAQALDLKAGDPGPSLETILGMERARRNDSPKG
jgi:hypothetical protein